MIPEAHTRFPMQIRDSGNQRGIPLRPGDEIAEANNRYQKQRKGFCENRKNTEGGVGGEGVIPE